MIQGEPQVPTRALSHDKLTERLNQNQPLAADELTRLGARRAEGFSLLSRKPALIRRVLGQRRPRRSYPMPASRCRFKLGWRQSRTDSGRSRPGGTRGERD